MHDILIELTVPSLNKTYDMTIPAAAQAHVVLALLVRVVGALSDGRFQSVAPVLCDCGSGDILSMNATPEEQGLKNGSRLMLI